MLCEGGPILAAFPLVLVLLVLFCILESTVQIARRAKWSLYQVALAVAIGSTLAHSIMNFTMYQLPNLILSGFLLAALAYTRGKFKQAAPLQIRPALVKAGFFIPATVVCLALVADSLSTSLVYRTEYFPFRDYVLSDEHRYFETMRWLSAIRSGNSTNHIAMATLYRMSMDRQADPQTRTSLAVASAVEYQAGLKLNPYRYRVQGYFADLLEQHPQAAHIAQIEMSPAELRRDAAEKARIYPFVHLQYAATLNAQDAYRHLVEHALPWVDLRYEGFRAHRHELLRILSSSASAYGDIEVLELVLAALETNEREQNEITAESGLRTRVCQASWRSVFPCLPW